jgi:hypothetical protein
MNLYVIKKIAIPVSTEIPVNRIQFVRMFFT